MNKTYKVNLFSDCASWNTHTDYYNGDTEYMSLEYFWLFTVRLHFQSLTQNACVPSTEAVCTNFMMVFGMTRPGLEPMTYCMRGRHANH